MRYCIPLLFAAALWAQEDFRAEVTAGAWILSTEGTIQSGITPVDLKSDLAIGQNVPRFTGRLVLMPARRHRFWVEGVPYHLSGSNQVTRTINFAGRTFTLSDQVVSEADIAYVAGGYQFDVISRDAGHLGLLAGIAYVNATGTLRSTTFGFTGTESQSFPYPIAGVDFRVVPRSPLVITGEAKGMSLGSYGHFVEASGNAGVNLGRYVTVLAGYMVVDADVHRKDQTRGLAPQFTGPVFSVQFRR